MEKQKHTLGTWDIETPCGFPYTGIYIVSHKANKDKSFHSFIAEIRQYREEGEGLANAYLMAAAPELLKELEGALNEICRLCVRLNPHHRGCQSCEDMIERRQAIAKAVGK